MLVLLESFKTLYKVNANPYITIGTHKLKQDQFISTEVIENEIFTQSPFACPYFCNNFFLLPIHNKQSKFMSSLRSFNKYHAMPLMSIRH